MKRITGILKIVGNKYLLATAVFAVFILFFDKNDIFTQLERKKQVKELEASKQFYQDGIEKTKRQLTDLQNNPAALEKYARENYYMKRTNEDVFIVDAQPASASKK